MFATAGQCSFEIGVERSGHVYRVPQLSPNFYSVGIINSTEFLLVKEATRVPLGGANTNRLKWNYSKNSCLQNSSVSHRFNLIQVGLFCSGPPGSCYFGIHRSRQLSCFYRQSAASWKRFVRNRLPRLLAPITEVDAFPQIMWSGHLTQRDVWSRNSGKPTTGHILEDYP